VSGYRENGDEGGALRALAAAGGVTEISARAAVVRSASHLMDSLEDGTLLVLGAAGGSWLHRQFFGPGARLTRRASGGTVIVRSAPVRAYQCMEDLEGFGPHLRAADALRLSSVAVVPVVEAGKLIGVVRRSVMLASHDGTEIGTLTEPAPHAAATDAVEELTGLDSFFEGAPVPVVDRAGRLVGGVRFDGL
jgi:CBS domain-containing protein